MRAALVGSSSPVDDRVDDRVARSRQRQRLIGARPARRVASVAEGEDQHRPLAAAAPHQRRGHGVDQRGAAAGGDGGEAGVERVRANVTRTQRHLVIEGHERGAIVG